MKKFFIICFFVISVYILLQSESIILIYYDYRVETNLFFPVAVLVLVASFFWTLSQQKASWMLYLMRRSYRRQATDQQAQIAVYEFRQELASFLIQQGWQNFLQDALSAHPLISATDLREKQKQWIEAQAEGKYEKAFSILNQIGLSIPPSIYQKMFIDGFSRQFEVTPPYLVPDIFDGLQSELNKKPALKNIFVLRLDLLKKEQQRFLLKQIDFTTCSPQEIAIIRDVINQSPQEWVEWFQLHNLDAQTDNIHFSGTSGLKPSHK